MNDTTFVIEPSRQDIIITRVFDAPKEVVFQALTDPEIIPNWWGPSDYTTVVSQSEVKPGGGWRYMNVGKEGDEYRFKGIYHDIAAPDRIVNTFEFEGMPGHVALESHSLEEVDGKTRYVAVSVFQSVEARDGAVAAGMEDGARESWNRLEEVVEELAKN